VPSRCDISADTVPGPKGILFSCYLFSYFNVDNLKCLAHLLLCGFRLALPSSLWALMKSVG
jgi:hypothetical protein